MRKIFCLAFFLVAALGLVILGQTPTAQRDQSIKIGTAEVQLDIVVKDKKGRFQRDLKLEDFEITEDGVKQNIGSFRLITRSGTAKSEETTAAPTPRPTVVAPEPTKTKREVERSMTAIALVFDRLTPDARRRAQLSAQSYVGEGVSQNNYTGVFLINLNLATLQSYTTDTALVRKALERMASSATSTFDPTAGIYTDNVNQTISAAKAASAGAASAAGAAGAAGGAGAAAAGAAAGAADVDRMLAQMQLRTKETFDRLQRDQQGYATVNGLLSVISSMERLPGRKAVLFFSEGVAIPPNVKQQFRSVINTANRANVSLYTIDSAGLRAESTTAAARDEINSRVRQRMDNLDQVHVGSAMTEGIERAEDLMNLPPQHGLIQLAEETGGQFIGDTNNIASKLRQVDEDLSSYYLLSYVPTNTNYDGKFRNVALKLKRSGLDVQTRKGYYAVNAGGSTPVLYYETPALAALANGRADNTIPMKTNQFNFPEAKYLGRTAFEVELPANAFTFAEDTKKKTYASDFSVVVLVKDDKQQVVRKLSTHYTLSGQLDQLPKMKSGLILFYREEDLPPGHYNVEAAAYDLPSNKISIRKTTIDVPDADETKLRLSSVVIVKRGEQLPPDRKSDSPFLAGNVLLYPNLGEPISKAAKQMGFFFTVYPAKDSTFTPALMVELLQSGKVLAAVPLKMPAPNESGRIPFVGNIPLDSLPPGDYEMRVTVRGDKGSAFRTTKFTVVP
ncbi:MAG TPA: VWA domain-containing protein [Blastocatellia bacterium]|nr:VWA domain-containing protein [Blastocatellia bacterium]